MTGREAMPRFIKPARATAVAVPPSGEAWVHEIKMDGYRVEARLEGGQVELLTRTGLDWTGRFLALVPAFAKLPAEAAIIDGEIIVEDERGVSDFSLLQAELKNPRSRRLAYVAFDLLHLDGESLLALPLAERKARLAALLDGQQGPIRYSQHLAGDGGEVLLAAAGLGLEGIVSKRLDRPYRPGREDWLKTKITLNDELVVCGYIEAASPRGAVGALVLGYFADGRLVHAGKVGTGFSVERAAGLWRRLEAMRVAEPPLPGRFDRDVRWVPPLLVAQIEYAGWTADGLVRHARFKGLREDKPATEVGRPGT